jgi:hypothetical protein
MYAYSFMMMSSHKSVSEYTATIMYNSEPRSFVFVVDRSVEMGVLKSPRDLYETCGSDRAGQLALAVAAFADAHHHDKLQLVLMITQRKYHAYVLSQRGLRLRSFEIQKDLAIEVSILDENPIKHSGSGGKIPVAISRIAEVARAFSKA